MINNPSPAATTNKSPKLDKRLSPLPFSPAEISAAASPLCAAYDHYLRLPELRKLWTSKQFPDWSTESIFKPALIALEITFRFISTVFADPRPYANRREWIRRVELLATSQIEMIAMLCEDEEEDPLTRGRAPVADDLTKNGSSRNYSEASLLPRLATWQKSKNVAQRILYSVECSMMRCPYTLGLGEPNLAGKPSLRYDDVCKPNEIHSLTKTTPYDDHIENYENQTVYTTHQMVESWVHVAHELVERINSRIEGKRLEEAKKDCYLVERIWKFLTDVEDVQLLMDPADFLKLKKQLAIKWRMGETAAFCFRSKELVEITKKCKELREKVPGILEVEVDPEGGPRIQEAAMRAYVDKRGDNNKVHVLQGLQGIESAMKRFFYAYKQVVVVLMGSFQASGNRVGVSWEWGDSLTQIFLEPTYFPSLDAAKTFLSYFWDTEADRH